MNRFVRTFARGAGVFLAASAVFVPLLLALEWLGFGAWSAFTSTEPTALQVAIAAFFGAYLAVILVTDDKDIDQ